MGASLDPAAEAPSTLIVVWQNGSSGVAPQKPTMEILPAQEPDLDYLEDYLMPYGPVSQAPAPGNDGSLANMARGSGDIPDSQSAELDPADQDSQSTLDA